MLRGNTPGRVSVWNVLFCLCVVAVMGAILLPPLTHSTCGTYSSNCESNMKEIGSAFKMYLSDNDDTYPTNRCYTAGGKLRPINDSTNDPSRIPISPFLTTSDARIGPTNCTPHGVGSFVLFNDSHVKLIPANIFPEQDRITRANCWDPKTRQWYNFGPGAKTASDLIGSIAITP